MTSRSERAAYHADDDVKSAREEGKGWWKPPLESLTRESFNSYDSGKIIAGIKWEIEGEWGTESHETYQFDSIEHVIGRAMEWTQVPGMLRVRIVTHVGGYKGMKTLAEWKR